MGEMLLAAMARGYAHLLARDMEALTGLLTLALDRAPEHKPRAVSDIAVDFATARRRP